MESVIGTEALFDKSYISKCYVSYCNNTSFSQYKIKFGYCYHHYNQIKDNDDNELYNIDNFLYKCKYYNCNLGCQLYIHQLYMANNKIHIIKIRDHFCFKH